MNARHAAVAEAVDALMATVHPNIIRRLGRDEVRQIAWLAGLEAAEGDPDLALTVRRAVRRADNSRVPEGTTRFGRGLDDVVGFEDPASVGRRVDFDDMVAAGLGPAEFELLRVLFSDERPGWTALDIRKLPEVELSANATRRLLRRAGIDQFGKPRRGKQGWTAGAVGGVGTHNVRELRQGARTWTLDGVGELLGIDGATRKLRRWQNEGTIELPEGQQRTLVVDDRSLLGLALVAEFLRQPLAGLGGRVKRRPRDWPTTVELANHGTEAWLCRRTGALSGTPHPGDGPQSSINCAELRRRLHERIAGHGLTLAS